MKIVFFGTNKFAVLALQALAKHFCISLVITKKPKPIGRKKIILPSPVEQKAKELGLEVDYGFEKIKEADLFVVIDYGKIIPQKVLDIPFCGAINVHPSELPKYRGASPLQTAILNGETKTAISIMLMDDQMDHGPILSQKSVNIFPNETYKELYERLSKEYPEFLVESIKKYLSGKLKPQEQNHKKATFTKIINRENGRIDWNKPAIEIERMIRAFDPWPGTFTTFSRPFQGGIRGGSEKRIKILSASVSSKFYPNQTAGQFFKTGSGELTVACGQNTFLVIHNLQIEGKKPMSGKRFIQGYIK